MHLKCLQFRTRTIVLLTGMLVGASSDISGQQIFREATETPSHRVLDGSSIPGLGLPNAIQSALLRRLDQHIRSGRQIDHDRLANMLERLPIDSQTRATVENMARIMSSQQSDGPPGVPEDLQQIVSRQVEEFQANQSRPQGQGGAAFDPTRFQEWLSSNRARAGEMAGAQGTRQKKLSQMYKRFQDRSRTAQRQSKQYSSRSDISAGNGESVTKRFLKSALEAMDESSMNFLRAAKNDEKKNGAWSLRWLKGATKSLNSSVRDVNRAFKKMSSRTTPASQQMVIPEFRVADDGGRRVWTTVLIVGALGLAGVLLRRRFLNMQMPDVTPRKSISFEANSIVDRTSLVDQ